MKIISLRLKNFLSFGNNEQKLNFSNLSTIVGPNDSGKTTVFRAIRLIGDLLRERAAPSEAYYHNGNMEKPFEIDVGIELNEEEVEAVSNFMICSILAESVNVEQNEDRDLAMNLIKEFVLQHSRKFFMELLQNITLIIRSESRTIYPSDVMIKISKNGKELFIYNFGQMTKKPTRQGSSNIHSMASLILSVIRQNNPKLVKDYLKRELKSMPRLPHKIQPLFDLCFNMIGDRLTDSVNFQGANLNNLETRYDNFLPLLRLREFMNKKYAVHDGVTITEVISTIYDNSIVRTSDLRSKPQTFLDENKDSRSNTNKLHNLTGENLPSVLFELKNSSNPRIKRRYNEILKNFIKITKGIEFDIAIRERKITEEPQNEIVPFSPSHDLGGILPLGIRSQNVESIRHELIIEFVKGDMPIPIEFAAAGRFETLLLLTALIGHNNKVILLDEPALNLHPMFQRIMLELIEKTTKKDNQVLLITHSPYLVNAENLESMWRFTSTKSGTKVVNLRNILDNSNDEEGKKLIQHLRDSDIRSILFSRGVVLVEGPSDKLVIEKIDKYLSTKNKGANIEDNDWIVIDIGGKDSLPIFINLCTKLELPHLSIMDYDTLMYCGKTIKKDNDEIKTSSIPFYVHLTGGITQKEFANLKKMSKLIHIYEIPKVRGTKTFYNKQAWYDKKCLNALSKLAKSHNIFVWTGDLEGVLQTHLTHKDSKPLKAFDVIYEKIFKNSIPEEFNSMLDYVKKTIVKNRI